MDNLKIVLIRWLLPKLYKMLSKAQVQAPLTQRQIEDRVNSAYRDIWPKHHQYEEKTKAILRNLICHATREACHNPPQIRTFEPPQDKGFHINDYSQKQGPTSKRKTVVPCKRCHEHPCTCGVIKWKWRKI